MPCVTHAEELMGNNYTHAEMGTVHIIYIQQTRRLHKTTMMWHRQFRQDGDQGLHLVLYSRNYYSCSIPAWVVQCFKLLLSLLGGPWLCEEVVKTVKGGTTMSLLCSQVPT